MRKGEVYGGESATDSQHPEHKIFHLTAREVCEAIVQGYVPADNPLSSDELADKSNGDAFTKTIAVLQIAYFLIGVISRATQRLPVSQLEVGATAFVCCSVITYSFLFSKPKGVATTTTLTHYHDGPPAYVRLFRRGEPWAQVWRHAIGMPITNIAMGSDTVVCLFGLFRSLLSHSAQYTSRRGTLPFRMTLTYGYGELPRWRRRLLYLLSISSG